VNDFDSQKQKHLEKLATKMLEEQDKIIKFKEKNINTDFLKLF
jgi:vacuolar-type H+-ATPase subunit H